MNKKNKVLIVGTGQLPHRHLFNMCSALSDHFDITVISPFEGLEKKSSDKFEIVYTDIPQVKHKNRMRLLHKYYTLRKLIANFISIKKYEKTNKFDLIYIWDQSMAMFVKFTLGRHNRYIMQMFTQSVANNKLINFFCNMRTKINTMCFDHIFMGSRLNMDFFRIPERKVHITGAAIEAIQYMDRSFKEINLVYLGALSNRNVHETIEGFAKFYSEYKNKINVSYHIIGSGLQEHINKLTSAIKKHEEQLPITYHGWLTDDEIKKIFEQTNIGIVYNPVTPYYTNNISTKLFEYIFSGMPVISVNNKSTEKIIDKTNGILIEDNPVGFYNGLVQIYQNLGKFKSENIIKTCKEYSVEYNIKNKIVPVFNSIINEK